MCILKDLIRVYASFNSTSYHPPQPPFHPQDKSSPWDPGGGNYLQQSCPGIVGNANQKKLLILSNYISSQWTQWHFMRGHEEHTNLCAIERIYDTNILKCYDLIDNLDFHSPSTINVVLLSWPLVRSSLSVIRIFFSPVFFFSCVINAVPFVK